MILKPAARYPVDPRVVFILAFSVFTGITALALETGPESLESQLPRWGVLTWGVILSVGSLVTLIGIAKQSLNGIITEQIGSVMVGVAALFYSTVAVYTIGWDAVQVVGIIFAWGLACFARWFQLQALIVTAYHRQVRKEIADVFRQDVADGFGPNIDPEDRS